jgi:hypothetical protein
MIGKGGGYDKPNKLETYEPSAADLQISTRAVQLAPQMTKKRRPQQDLIQNSLLCVDGSLPTKERGANLEAPIITLKFPNHFG